MINFFKPTRKYGNGIVLNDEFLYFPVPKNACTSLKREAYFYVTGKDFKTKHFPFNKKYTVHHYYPSNEFRNYNCLENTINICNVRDPIERFISGFENRIVKYNDLQISKEKICKAGLEVSPKDINYFIKNIDKYMNLCPITNHHFLPQSFYLGKDYKFYDRDFSKNIFKTFESLTARKSAEFKKSSNDNKEQLFSGLNTASISKLEKFYCEDFRLYEYIYS